MLMRPTFASILRESYSWIDHHPHATTDDIPDALLDEWLCMPSTYHSDPTTLQWSVFTYGYIRKLTMDSSEVCIIPVAQMRDRYSDWFMILGIAKMNRISEACRIAPLGLFDFSPRRKIIARRGPAGSGSAKSAKPPTNAIDPGSAL